MNRKLAIGRAEKCSRDGFTLIECVNNLHQLGVAMSMYLEDNGHNYPYFQFWVRVLEPYYKGGWNTNRSYQCPSTQDTPFAAVNFGQDVNYAYNVAGTDFQAFTSKAYLGLGMWRALGLRHPQFQKHRLRFPAKCSQSPIRGFIIVRPIPKE